MIEVPILRDLSYVILAATTMLLITRRVGVPPIVAYLLGGLGLGLLGVLAVSDSLHLFSELGIALLLFIVGLELSVQKIRDVGRPAVIAGVLQVVVTFGIGYGLATLLGYGGTPGIFLGLATTFSSTVVVVKLLDRAGNLTSLHGRLSIGILLVQDLVVAIVLTVVGGLSGGGELTDMGALAGALGRSLLGMLLLALVAAAAVRWLLPPLFSWLADSAEALFVASLTWAFGFILAAEAMHISIELGAFIAGVAVAQLPYNHELQRRVHPLVNFFLAVFFVSLGASMDLGSAAQHWLAAAVLSFFVLVGKPLLIGWLTSRHGYAGETSFLTGLTLGQISEFAFILLGLAAGAGLVGSDILSLVGLIGLVTISGSAFLVPRGPRLHATLARRGLLPAFLRRDGRRESAGPERAGHVIVIGMNTLGRLVAQALADAGERVLAIDTDAEKLMGLSVEAVSGDVNRISLLEEIGVAKAKLVVSALQIQDVNSLLAYRCREMGVPTSIHAFDPALADELLEIGADHLMVSKHEGIRQMEAEFRRLGVLG